MTYYQRNGYTLMRRHWIILFFNYLSFTFLLIVSALLYYISIKYQVYLWYDLIMFIIFPVIFLIINYAFLKLLLKYINYYNNLIILKDSNVIVIKTSLLDTDNIEIIDLNKITKIDTLMEWIVANILSYGNLVLEQYKDRTRIFHHIYKPYRAANFIKESKSKLLEKNSKD